MSEFIQARPTDQTAVSRRATPEHISDQNEVTAIHQVEGPELRNQDIADAINLSYIESHQNRGFFNRLKSRLGTLTKVNIDVNGYIQDGKDLKFGERPAKFVQGMVLNLPMFRFLRRKMDQVEGTGAGSYLQIEKAESVWQRLRLATGIVLARDFNPNANISTQEVRKRINSIGIAYGDSSKVKEWMDLFSRNGKETKKNLRGSFLYGIASGVSIASYITPFLRPERTTQIILANMGLTGGLGVTEQVIDLRNPDIDPTEKITAGEFSEEFIFGMASGALIEGVLSSVPYVGNFLRPVGALYLSRTALVYAEQEEKLMHRLDNSNPSARKRIQRKAIAYGTGLAVGRVGGRSAAIIANEIDIELPRLPSGDGIQDSISDIPEIETADDIQITPTYSQDTPAVITSEVDSPLVEASVDFEFTGEMLANVAVPIEDTIDSIPGDLISERSLFRNNPVFVTEQGESVDLYVNNSGQSYDIYFTQDGDLFQLENNNGINLEGVTNTDGSLSFTAPYTQIMNEEEIFTNLSNSNQFIDITSATINTEDWNTVPISSFNSDESAERYIEKIQDMGASILLLQQENDYSDIGTFNAAELARIPESIALDLLNFTEDNLDEVRNLGGMDNYLIQQLGQENVQIDGIIAQFNGVFNSGNAITDLTDGVSDQIVSADQVSVSSSNTSTNASSSTASQNPQGDNNPQTTTFAQDTNQQINVLDPIIEPEIELIIENDGTTTIDGSTYYSDPSYPRSYFSGEPPAFSDSGLDVLPEYLETPDGVLLQQLESDPYIYIEQGRLIPIDIQGGDQITINLSNGESLDVNIPDMSEYASSRSSYLESEVIPSINAQIRDHLAAEGLLVGIQFNPVSIDDVQHYYRLGTPPGGLADGSGAILYRNGDFDLATPRTDLELATASPNVNNSEAINSEIQSTNAVVLDESILNNWNNLSGQERYPAFINIINQLRSGTFSIDPLLFNETVIDALTTEEMDALIGVDTGTLGATLSDDYFISLGINPNASRFLSILYNNGNTASRVVSQFSN